jgi:aspartate carbamoyltransferase
MDALFALADEFSTRLNQNERLRVLDGKLLTTLFYEPSTRTQLAFQSAMQKLGGGILSCAPTTEPLADTIRSIASYADALVLRHSQAGSAKLAADLSTAPIINAGDGNGEQPVQALIDLYTIRAEKQTIDTLNIAIVGDLKNSRAAHSLARALGKYKVDFSFVAPAALAMPIEICDELRERDFIVEETNDLAKSLRRADVVYMTRVHKEYFTDLKQYDKMKNFFVLTRDLITKTKENLLVMHPLPRAEELGSDVDALPNAAYFRASQRAVVVNMALLATVLQP